MGCLLCLDVFVGLRGEFLLLPMFSGFWGFMYVCCSFISFLFVCVITLYYLDWVVFGFGFWFVLDVADLVGLLGLI